MEKNHKKSFNDLKVLSKNLNDLNSFIKKEKALLDQLIDKSFQKKNEKFIISEAVNNLNQFNYKKNINVKICKKSKQNLNKKKGKIKINTQKSIAKRSYDNFKEVFKKNKIKKPRIVIQQSKNEKISTKKKEKKKYIGVKKIVKEIKISREKLSCLKTFLLSILLDNKITNKMIKKLSFCEREIYKFILKRKEVYIGKNDCLNLNAEFIEDYYSIKSNRRNEEYLKYIFMQSMKFLKKEYFRQNSKYIKKSTTFKEDKDRAFYKFYFNNVCKNEGKKLEQFFIPNRIKNDFDKKNQCSINNLYINLVSKSDHFLNDFKRFLEGNFCDQNNNFKGIIDYNKKIIKKKLNFKIQQWENILQKNSIKNGLKIISFKINAKRFKLPWTINEVKKGVLHVKKVFKLDFF